MGWIEADGDALLPAGQAATVLEASFIAAGDVHEIAYAETVLDGRIVYGFAGMPL